VSALGAFAGLLAASGLLLVVSRVPIGRRPRLADRMGPYLHGVAAPSALLGTGGAGRTGTVGRRLGPALAELGRSADRIVGGSASVRRRLAALGSPLSVETFRQEQVLWAGAGGALGLLLLTVRLGTSVGPPALSLAGLTLLGVVVGFWARDYYLSRAVLRREELIALELPTVAELLALAVGAGESPLAALERVTRRATGELSRELRVALGDTRAGAPFTDALAGVAERTSLPALGRFVDGMSVALQRGTPLAEVLRAQAVDAREAGRRDLLESGGKREIAMMIPVVFLVLPVTILFALYPGAVTLTSISH
jgi:tight adherence protein C